MLLQNSFFVIRIQSIAFRTKIFKITGFRINFIYLKISKLEKMKMYNYKIVILLVLIVLILNILCIMKL